MAADVAALFGMADHDVADANRAETNGDSMGTTVT